MPAIVVGDIDTGLNYVDQPQLVWINQGEIPKSILSKYVDVDGDLVLTFKDLNDPKNAGLAPDSNSNNRIDGADILKAWSNGQDDDGNGYADDLIGWNFANGNNNTLDWHSHGSWVAGVIADAGKPSTYVVPILFMGPNSSGDLTKCIDYFTGLANAAKSRRGAERFIATNNSYAGVGAPDAYKAAIGRAATADLLFVAAAGNQRLSNNDITPPFPASLSSNRLGPFDNVIAVTAVVNGNLVGNYGPRAVDIAATSGGTTSEASGRVAGTVAAFASKWTRTTATAKQIKATLLKTAVGMPSLTGKVVSNGALDPATFLAATPASPTASDFWPWGETLIGTTSSNTFTGTTLADLIVGDPGVGSRQTSQVDTVTGGAAADLFIVGKGYAAGRSNDYLVITDFVSGTDKIGVYGPITDYEWRSFSNRSLSGVGVYRKSDGELLAVAKRKRLTEVNSSTDFVGTDIFTGNNF